MPVSNAFSLPFSEQIAFFRNKLNLPTERWDDIKKQAHDKAFIIAGVTNAELLNDLRQAVDSGIANGTTIEDFRKKFFALAEQYGWTSYTGSDTEAGKAWRTRVIYNTNLRTSFGAGRWAQLKESVDVFPYWKWVHKDDQRFPRPEHMAWDGLTLAHDDTWWETHYPPCAFGCKCTVTGVTKGDIKRGKATLGTAPEINIDPKTGLDRGISKGWDYAPGASAADGLFSFVSGKLINFNGRIGAQLWESLSPYLSNEASALFEGWMAGKNAAPVIGTLSESVFSAEVGDVSAAISPAAGLEDATGLLDLMREPADIFFNAAGRVVNYVFAQKKVVSIALTKRGMANTVSSITEFDSSVNYGALIKK